MTCLPTQNQCWSRFWYFLFRKGLFQWPKQWIIIDPVLVGRDSLPLPRTPPPPSVMLKCTGIEVSQVLLVVGGHWCLHRHRRQRTPPIVVSACEPRWRLPTCFAFPITKFLNSRNVYRTHKSTVSFECQASRGRGAYCTLGGSSPLSVCGLHATVTVTVALLQHLIITYSDGMIQP